MASASACIPNAERVFAADAAFHAGFEWAESSQSALTRDEQTDSLLDERKLEAFVQAAEKHRNQLMWLALRMMHSYEDAEDVVQRALLKAFRNLDKFRGDSQMTTWL